MSTFVVKSSHFKIYGKVHGSINWCFNQSISMYIFFLLQIDASSLEEKNSSMPVITCLTEIYHPNIDPYDAYTDSNVCLNILDSALPGSIGGLQSVVLGLIWLLKNPNLDDTLSPYFDGRVEEDIFAENVNLYMRGEAVGDYVFTKNFKVVDGQTIMEVDGLKTGAPKETQTAEHSEEKCNAMTDGNSADEVDTHNMDLNGKHVLMNENTHSASQRDSQTSPDTERMNTNASVEGSSSSAGHDVEDKAQSKETEAECTYVDKQNYNKRVNNTNTLNCEIVETIETVVQHTNTNNHNTLTNAQCANAEVVDEDDDADSDDTTDVILLCIGGELVMANKFFADDINDTQVADVYEEKNCDAGKGINSVEETTINANFEINAPESDQISAPECDKIDVENGLYDNATDSGNDQCSTHVRYTIFQKARFKVKCVCANVLPGKLTVVPDVRRIVARLFTFACISVKSYEQFKI